MVHSVTHWLGSQSANSWAAMATVAAVLAALWQGWRDRKAAELALRAQMQSAEQARRREHHVELMLRVLEETAIADAYQHGPQYGEASGKARGLVAAIPEEFALPWTRWTYANGPRPRDAHETGFNARAQGIRAEVAEQIERLMSDG